MYRLRKPFSCLLLALFTFLLTFIEPVKAQDNPLSSQQVDRLTKMADLWGTVKYFHPFMAYREIPWDSAMAAAMPAVLDAENPDAYAEALTSLLSVLEDPATHVLQAEAQGMPGTRDLQPVMTWSPDSVLIVTLNESTLNLNDYAIVFQILEEVKTELATAKATVF